MYTVIISTLEATRRGERGTHVSLNHLHAPLPHFVDDTGDVNHLLLLHLLQHNINNHESACSANTSTVGCREALIAGARRLLAKGANLQWTSMGPSDGLCSCLTRR